MQTKMSKEEFLAVKSGLSVVFIAFMVVGSLVIGYNVGQSATSDSVATEVSSCN